ncbi:MAG: TrmB family transcriptional regulator [Bryobacterales bacterium]|nr:TrmB family transcriptional regulator [Bryobacterales bacterium]
MNERALELLRTLGLNDLESEVYVFLLSHPATTGYGIAKAIKRPTANTYKAIESLGGRGAVLVEEGENRLCRAVPASEFIGHLQSAFERKTKEAEAALSAIEAETDDERVYRLESVPHLMERCRQMLEVKAERLAVVDAFPEVLEVVLPSIERAVARGVDVLVQAYAPVEVPGAQVVIPAVASQVQLQWKSQQLNVTVDGREAVVALLSNGLERVIQGIWTNSLYVTCIVEAGLMAEHTIHQMRAIMGDPDSAEKMQQILARHRFFLNSEVPGQRELLARFVERG